MLTSENDFYLQNMILSKQPQVELSAYKRSFNSINQSHFILRRLLRVALILDNCAACSANLLEFSIFFFHLLYAD